MLAQININIYNVKKRTWLHCKASSPETIPELNLLLVPRLMDIETHCLMVSIPSINFINTYKGEIVYMFSLSLENLL